jgi:hypothetical protein
MADCTGEEGNGGFGMSDKLIIRPSDSPFFIKMGGNFNHFVEKWAHKHQQRIFE